MGAAGEDASTLAGVDWHSRHDTGCDLSNDAKLGVGCGTIRGADRVAVAKRFVEGGRIGVGANVRGQHAAENAAIERRLDRLKRLRVS